MTRQRNRSRGWCFTINNYVPENLLQIFEAGADYIAFGFEVGDSGTPHIQGYLWFENPIEQEVAEWLFPVIGERAKADGSSRHHVEAQKARDPKRAYIYTMKEGCWYEFPDKDARPEQGHRSDMENLITRIQKGETLDALMSDYPVQVTMYRNKLETLINSRPIDKSSKCEVIVYMKKKEDILNWMDEHYDDKKILYCTEERDLYEYNDSYDAVCYNGSMDQFKLGQLVRHKPLLVRNGFQTKNILPKVFIFVDLFFSDRSDLTAYIKFVKDLPDNLGTEVSGVILAKPPGDTVSGKKKRGETNKMLGDILNYLDKKYEDP